MTKIGEERSEVAAEVAADGNLRRYVPLTVDVM